MVMHGLLKGCDYSVQYCAGHPPPGVPPSGSLDSSVSDDDWHLRWDRPDIEVSGRTAASRSNPNTGPIWSSVDVDTGEGIVHVNWVELGRVAGDFLTQLGMTVEFELKVSVDEGLEGVVNGQALPSLIVLISRINVFAAGELSLGLRLDWKALSDALDQVAHEPLNPFYDGCFGAI